MPGLNAVDVQELALHNAWLVCCSSAWAASHKVPGVSAAEVHELKAIRDALAAIAPTKAIWKLHPTDLKSLEERNVSLDIPASIMVTHFAPQNSLLGHPKLRAFLTQAGTNSFLEASCSARDDLPGSQACLTPQLCLLFCHPYGSGGCVATCVAARLLRWCHVLASVLGVPLVLLCGGPMGCLPVALVS